MKIPIPLPLVHAFDAWLDWANVDVIAPVRRIDVLGAIGFVVTIGWYAQYSWRAAIMNGAAYLLLSVGVLFIKFRSK